MAAPQQPPLQHQRPPLGRPASQQRDLVEREPLPVGSESASRLLAIVEVILLTGDLLVGLMSLARDEQAASAALRQCQPGRYGPAAVEFHRHPRIGEREPLTHLGSDGRSRLAPRVIARHDHGGQVAKRGREHGGTLDPVAVSAAAQHDDRAGRGGGCQQRCCAFHRIRGVGIVAIDGRLAGARTSHQLEPARHPGEVVERGDDRLQRCTARCLRERYRKRRIGEVVGARHGEPTRGNLARDSEAEGLPEQARRRGRPVAPLCAAVGIRCDKREQLRTFERQQAISIAIDRADKAARALARRDGAGALLHKERPLGGEVGLHVAMEIEVVRRQVGEACEVEMDAAHPPKRKAVARDLHDDRPGAAGQPAGRDPMEQQAVGRCVGSRQLLAPEAIPDRSEVTAGQPDRIEHPLHHAGRGGLAVGTRDADDGQVVEGVAIEGRRQFAHPSLALLAHKECGDRQASKGIAAGADDRNCATRDRLFDAGMAIDACADAGHKEAPRHNLA